MDKKQNTTIDFEKSISNYTNYLEASDLLNQAVQSNYGFKLAKAKWKTGVLLPKTAFRSRFTYRRGGIKPKRIVLERERSYNGTKWGFWALAIFLFFAGHPVSAFRQAISKTTVWGQVRATWVEARDKNDRQTRAVHVFEYEFRGPDGKMYYGSEDGSQTPGEKILIYTAKDEPWLHSATKPSIWRWLLVYFVGLPIAIIIASKIGYKM